MSLHFLGDTDQASRFLAFSKANIVNIISAMFDRPLAGQAVNYTSTKRQPTSFAWRLISDPKMYYERTNIQWYLQQATSNFPRMISESEKVLKRRIHLLILQKFNLGSFLSTTRWRNDIPILIFSWARFVCCAMIQLSEVYKMFVNENWNPMIQMFCG